MATNPADDKDRPMPGGDTVLVDIKDQIAWVTMNRPEKRNAISPALAAEMLNVIEDLAINDRRGVRVLTGVGIPSLRHGPERVFPRHRPHVAGRARTIFRVNAQ